MPPFLNDAHPPHGPELAGQSVCIRSYSLVAEQAYAAILKGLADPSLFPSTDLSLAESLGTMARVKSSPAVRTLTSLFADACLEPQLGYNASSGRISFTIPLPVGFSFVWSVKRLDHIVLPCISDLSRVEIGTVSCDMPLSA
jgi:hypothetical protein